MTQELVTFLISIRHIPHDRSILFKALHGSEFLDEGHECQMLSFRDRRRGGNHGVELWMVRGKRIASNSWPLWPRPDGIIRMLRVTSIKQKKSKRVRICWHSTGDSWGDSILFEASRLLKCFFLLFICFYGVVGAGVDSKEVSPDQNNKEYLKRASRMPNCLHLHYT